MSQNPPHKIKSVDSNLWFVSIDFINSDFSKAHTITKLAKGIVDFCKTMILFAGKFDEEPVVQSLKDEMVDGRVELKALQNDFRSYMNHLFRLDNRISNAEFKSLKKYFDSEDRKFAEELKRIGTKSLSGWPYFKAHNGPLGIIKPMLCYDLRRRVPYHSVLVCKGCKKFFFYGNSYRSTEYCSSQCKDLYHSHRRTETGEHATYMRAWRKRTKKLKKSKR